MRTSLAVCVSLAAGLLACGNAAPVGHKTLRPTFDWSSSSDLIPGQILVDLKDDVSDSDIRDIESKYGVVLTEANEVAHQYRYEEATIPGSLNDELDVVNKLRTDARVEHAEPMTQYHALFTPNDPKYSEQYGLTRIGMESAWNMSCGMGVKVASLDTGVACRGEHRMSDLAECGEGFNAVDNDNDTTDRQSHGTHTVGSIAQLTNNGIEGAGVAPCVSIMPVKVLSDHGSGSNEGIAEGIRWAVDHGAQVINMSLGGPSPSAVLKDACQYAHDKGVVVVAAAGNSGPGNNTVGYPAAFPTVIAVSAIGPDDKIAGFSSRGPQVAIAAPGVDIGQQTICDENPEGCFLKYSGTSMSSPIVAGTTALIVGSGITDVDAVKEKLQSTADSAGDKNLYGAGIANAAAAVRSTLLSHFMISIVALLGLLFVARKTIQGQWKNPLSLLGMTLGGFGFLPLAFTGILPRMGMFRVVGELAMRPFGNWDMVLGHGHSLLLLASAIPTVIISLLMVGHSKLRLFSGGFALGAAALCGQIAYSNDVRFALGSLVMRLMMIGSAFICMYFASVSFSASVAKKTA